MAKGRISNFESWFTKYNPIENHIDDNAAYDGLMFETFGKEVEFVKEQPRNYIWTLVEGERNKMVLMSDWHIVNRIGYFITKEPWTDNLLEIII